MSLTKPIPKKLRDEMDADPFYEFCCVTGIRKSAGVKIEWHHAFTFAGKRVNEKWCILPVSVNTHRQAGTSHVKELLDWVMFNRADEDTLRRYSKAVDLIRERDRLNDKFGVWTMKI